MAEKVGGIYYEVEIDTRRMLAAQREIDRTVGSIQTSFTKMAAAVSAAIAAIAIDGLISKVVNAQRQFDVLFSSLKTVTGGTEQAGAAFDRLQKFAEKTPYSLDQAVNGFVKLKALGLAPTERAMTSFGNTASAMGKSLTQMIEAVADASTGEFERLKEFGIKAKQDGDRVSLTFQGVTTTIGNNAREITEYLTKIGEVEFAGAMSERMKTLDGDISNLEDSLAGLYRTIAQSGVGDAIAGGVRLASEAIIELSKSIKQGELTPYFDGLSTAMKTVELVAVSAAGVFAGRMVAATRAAAAEMVAKAAATREAAAAELLNLKAAQSNAFAQAQTAAAARVAALATAEQAAANLASARSSVQLLAAQAEQAAMNARLLVGKAAYFEAMAVERTVTSQLAAAKVAETEATAALATAERALAVARGQSIGAASAATAATTTLTAAKSAQAAAASLAARASSAAGGVLAALGGPVGIAVTALILLALNWDKVGGQARDAAEIAEEAAERIANALRKSQGRATQDLAEQLGEVRGEIKAIDTELANTKFPLADPKELDELRRRRAQLIGVASDIQAAMDKLHGGAGRGRVNPELVQPDPSGGPTTKVAKFDSVGYLKTLEAQTLEGMSRIDAMEKEALRRNAGLLQEGKITRAEAAHAATTIERNAAQERLDIQLKNAEDIRSAMEEASKQEQDALKKHEEDKRRAVAFASGVVAAGDPAEQVRLQYEAQLGSLQEARAAELLTEQQYAAAVVANAEQMQIRLAEIAQQRVDAERAAQQLVLSMTSSAAGQLLDILQRTGKDRTALAKSLFLAQKAIAVAEILINTEVAAAKMVGVLGPFGIPMASMIRATGYASAAMVGGMAIGEVAGGRQYGGPTTAGQLYRVNETGRPEMFTAANGSQYMLPTANGNVTPANQVGAASGGWTININNAPPGTQATVNDQARVIEIAVAAAESNFVDQVANNQGRMWNALAGASNVQGRLS